jgi:hypothetical protein
LSAAHWGALTPKFNIDKALVIQNVQANSWEYEALSENFVVGPRASVFSPGKDGEAGDIEYIVDAAGRSPGGKQAARSQMNLTRLRRGLFWNHELNE